MGATQELARFLVETEVASLPDWTIHQAKRCFINFLGVALYASRHPSVDILMEMAREEGGSARASVIGRGVKTSLLDSALINGYLAHLEDYDDTHFPTVLHGSAPLYAAMGPLAEDGHTSGRDFLASFVLGFEVAARIALSVHPWHYAQGWHVTGTAGVFGATAGAGRLLRLDVRQTCHALGIAGTQSAGLREVMGSTCKPLHAAKAAANGLQAALLAKRGFTSAETILEGRRGFWHVLSPKHDAARLTDGLGQRWELAHNGLKPYACGVVAHPLIDAMIALRRTQRPTPAEVETIEARVHPLVLELMDRPDPRHGLEGKFSVQHAAAVALVHGACYPAQFSDALVSDPDLSELRRRFRLIPDGSLGENQATVKVLLRDGRTLNHRIEHATGSPQNPMTDAQLEEKFRTLADHVLAPAQVQRVLAALWQLDRASDLADVISLLAPGA